MSKDRVGGDFVIRSWALSAVNDSSSTVSILSTILHLFILSRYFIFCSLKTLCGLYSGFSLLMWVWSAYTAGDECGKRISGPFLLV